MKSCKCWRPLLIARNPPIFLLRSLPTMFQNNARSWLCFFSMGKSTEAIGTQLSHELRQRCGEILQTIWGILRQQEHQNVDLKFFYSWQQGDWYGRESGWRGSCTKASPKRFCDQLNVVICGWKYGTVLRPHACGCKCHSYHSQAHTFWERTCKGTFQRSSNRTLQGFPIIIHRAEKLDTPIASPTDVPEIPEPKKKPAKKPWAS